MNYPGRPRVGSTDEISYIPRSRSSVQNFPQHGSFSMLPCVDDFQGLAAHARVHEDDVRWLNEHNIKEVGDMARCAPTEEMLWETVINRMEHSTSDLSRGPRIVAFWEMARAQKGLNKPLLPELNPSASADLGIQPTVSRNLARSSSVLTSQEIILSKLRSDGRKESQEKRASKVNPDVSEANFWCGCLMKRGRCTKSDKSMMDQVTVAGLCDLTWERVSELFSRFDQDGSGSVEVEELKDGMRKQGFEMDDAGATEILLHVLGYRESLSPDSPSGKRKFTVEDFDIMLKFLRLAELFTPGAAIFQVAGGKMGDYTEDRNPIRCVDYVLETFSTQDPVSAQFDYKDFFFGARGLLPVKNKKAKIPTRWVHVNATRGLDRLTVLRLAVKYHLHPIAITEIFDNRIGTKMEVYQDNYFLSVEILMLAENPDSDRVENDESSQRVRIHRSHVSVFLAGRKTDSFDTLVTIHQEKVEDHSWITLWRGSDGRAAPVGEIWGGLKKDLEHDPPRRIREQRADFLLYEVLRRILDEMRPITEAYAKRLGSMRQQEESGVSQECLHELADIDLELADLSRTVRPLRGVVKKFLDDKKIEASVKAYFKELEESWLATNEDVTQLSHMSRSLLEASERRRDKKTNDILGTITMISAFFMPAQFITGIYGMNFTTMPELTWRQGYIFFWCLQAGSLVLAMVVALWMKYGLVNASRMMCAWCRRSFCHCCRCCRCCDIPKHPRLARSTASDNLGRTDAAYSALDLNSDDMTELRDDSSQWASTRDVSTRRHCVL